MNDSVRAGLGGSEPVEPASGRSAGALLRAARERQGLHIAVLAATIKVAPAKLEALEQDRYDALPNPTFVRALAQSVCRSLKIDPRPVLALLPQVDTVPLESAAGTLNTPFHDKPGRGEPRGFSLSSTPLFWAGGLLLVAAVAVYLLPPEWLAGWSSGAPTDRPTSETAVAVQPVPLAAPASSAPVAAAASMADAGPGAMPPAAVASASLPAASVPGAMTPRGAPAGQAVAPAAAPAAPASSAAAPLSAAAPAGTASAPAVTGPVRLSTSAPSWIEAIDGRGQILLSRVLEAGEVVGLEGTPPWRLKIGNVRGTRLELRGQPVDLAPNTRDNVARVELR